MKLIIALTVFILFQTSVAAQKVEVIQFDQLERRINTKPDKKLNVYNFWATWCGPCIREIPSVKKTYEELNAKGFEIIGISLDSDKGKLEDFIAKNDMPWPQFFDGKGWKTSLAQEHGISSIPAMWLVDKEGNLVDQNARTDLEEKVKKYLAL